MIHFVVPRSTEFGIQDYLALRGQGLAGRLEVLHYEDLPRRTSLPSGGYVFSALDQLLPPGRQVACQVYDQLTRAGQGVRALNDPAATLLRYDLLDALFRFGLNRHRAARATEDLSGLRFPLFLREENRHTGALTRLLQTPAELEAELGMALVRGLRLEELLAVEFWETADAAGYYRKYTAFIVGTEIIPRALNYGRFWALKHSGTEFTREMLAEERDYVRSNPHEAQLRRIFDAGRVEYGRIDYSLKDGAVETWEINLNPTIGRGRRPSSGTIPDALQPLREEARVHFFSRLQAALEALDPPGKPSVMIPIRFRSGGFPESGPLVRGAHPARRFESIRVILRPFKPLLDPIVRMLSPLFGKAVRRKPPMR